MCGAAGALTSGRWGSGLGLLFVYGTLLPGQRYAPVAASAGAEPRFAASMSAVELYHLEAEGYPALIPGNGIVHGIVYEMVPGTGEGFALLDRLEGVERLPPEYHRRRWPLMAAASPPGSTAQRQWVWVYFYARPDRLRLGRGGRRLVGGRWDGVLDDAEAENRHR